MTQTKEITLTKEETQAIQLAEKLAITTSDQMVDATRNLSVLNQTLDRLTEDKELLTKPINLLLKEIRGRYKPFEDKLEYAISAIRKSMITYQTEQKRLAKIEEDKIISRIGDGKGKLKVETAIKKMESIDKPDQKVSTDEGSIKFRSILCFEIVDVSKIPKEFILANEVAIRKEMLAGREVSGVRYFTEEVPFNSR
jgi:hypothetical protein